MSTHRQIENREIANQKIFNALKAGREITFLDSPEFGCSEMHTQICTIRQKIQKRDLPYILEGRWVEFAPGQRCKAYKLIAKCESESCLY